MITHGAIGRQGRLGNQLYQYAMLLGVQARHGYGVKLQRPFDPTQTAKPCMDGTNALAGFDLTPDLYVDHIALPYLYNETDYGGEFQHRVFDQPDGTSFVGWYQSWRYFQNAEATVRREFQFRPDVIKAAQCAFPAEYSPLVSINVRRGDYLLPPHNAFFVNLSAAYYKNVLWEFHPITHYLVVSDDIEWCKHYFVGDRFHFLNTGNYWVDMCCIGMCDHHIIANSSFAWWAAWLNPKPDKRVIVPSAWYKPGKHPTWRDYDHNPPEWQRFKVIEE